MYDLRPPVVIPDDTGTGIKEIIDADVFDEYKNDMDKVQGWNDCGNGIKRKSKNKEYNYGYSWRYEYEQIQQKRVKQ